MKLSAIAGAAVVASIAMCSASFAQGNSHRGGADDRQSSPPQNQPQDQQYHHQQRDNARHDAHRPERQYGYKYEPRYEQRYEQRYQGRHEPRYEPRYDQRDGRWNARRDYYNARGPQFSRGAYIPREYRNHHYFVTNYRVHRLPPPPRHHQWVQVGSDYVLIALATGIIASIVLNQ